MPSLYDVFQCSFYSCIVLFSKLYFSEIINSSFVLCYNRSLYANVRNVGGKDRLSAVLQKRIFFKSTLSSDETYVDKMSFLVT